MELVATSPPARVRVAQVLAFVALVAALVGALGPAERVRTTYSWPPATLPEGAPDRAWYTPLLLVRHRPETLAARIPCTLPPALPRAGRPVTVLATARDPERVGGLAVRASGRMLTVSLGDVVLDRFDLPPRGAGSDCAYVVRAGSAGWSLEGGPDEVARGGALDDAPRLTGLFSSIDLREGGPSVEVTTAVHATRASTRQTVAWTIAALSIIAALLLVAVERIPRRPWASVARAVRDGVGKAHPADLVVGAVLAGWWVLSPVFWDDGFILERVEQYSTSGGFSSYFNVFGVNHPLGYWLEWGQHVLVDVSRAIIFMRLPALVALAGTWLVCRYILARVVPSSTAESGIVLWAMASAFLVGALSWGMTLRPEPFMALLVTAVMACMVRFSQVESAAPLAAIAFLIPLALNGHHSAVVSLAPVVVCVPRLFRWARSHAATASVLVTASAALVFVLLFIGADIVQRRDDTQVHRAVTARLGAELDADAGSWRTEVQRYELLTNYPHGTPLRRGSVALIALVVLVWLWRRRRNDGLRSFPASVLAAGLVLLIATPSKWPWHFGALIGLLAVAVATETARFRDEKGAPRASGALPFVAVGAAVVAASWSWWPRTGWNPGDLRTLSWTLGFETWLPFVQLVTLLPVLLLGILALRGRRRRQTHAWGAAAHAVGSRTAAVLAAPLIAFTFAVLIADSVKASSWTLTRQNLGTLAGDAGCGLGDDLVTSERGSVRPLAPAGAASVPTPPWVPPAPIERLSRFALAPASGGFGASAWFALPPERDLFGLFIAGTPSPTDRLSLEWGHAERGRFVSLQRERIGVNFIVDDGSAIVSWRLLSAAELPGPPDRADVVRVILRSDDDLGAAVAVTAPVTYENQTLSDRLQPSVARSLIVPKLVTYFPCVRQPVLREGTVEVPRFVLGSDDVGKIWPLGHLGSSPFDGIRDLYRLEQLPLADSRDLPTGVFVYEVVQELPGAMQAPPTRSTWTS